MVHWGDRELIVTPYEHWDAVLSWGERFEGLAEEIEQIMTEGDLVFSDLDIGAFIGANGTGYRRLVGALRGMRGRSCELPMV